MKTVLVTGATGFVGGFIVEECLRRGLNVHVGIRSSSQLTYLPQEAIQTQLINLADQANLQDLFSKQKYDYVIHNAGLTKGSRSALFRVNCQFTQNIVEALIASGQPLEKFIYTSSLAAYGPADQQQKEIVEESDTPQPITAYGESKLAAENYLKQLSDFPYLIFRPTAVYGPREKDIFAFFKLVKNGIEPYIGRKAQQLTFIYVKDLARVMVDGLRTAETGKAYFVSDGAVYPSSDLGKYIKKALNKKTLSFKVPLPLVRGVAWINEAISKISGAYPALNFEKVRELQSLNWQCDIQPLQKDLNFKPSYFLEEGILETTDWYVKEKWL